MRSSRSLIQVPLPIICSNEFVERSALRQGTARSVNGARRPTLNFQNSNINNNAIPGEANGSASASAGNVVSGNLYNSWSDPFGGLASQGIFKLTTGSTYSGAGADQLDMGLDFDRLPQITGLKVTAGVTAALLEFDFTVPIGDAGATQPCILEVSTSRNLQSDLGT